MKIEQPWQPWRCLGVLPALMLAALGGCDPVAEPEVTPPVPQVTVMTLAPSGLVLTEDLPARVAPVRVADIRPQVSGIVRRRLFEQGANVRAGQALFEIDPAPFRAEEEAAAAALQRAEAVFAHARLQAERLEPLAQAEAISRQLHDDALSQRQQAEADVAQARAALSRRRLDLKLATVESPIAGRIGQTLVTEGALVASSDSTPMARVQQIDTVYVDVRRPAASLDALRQAMAAPATRDSGLPVAVLDDDGSPLDLKGHMLFSGIEVNADTGDVLLRMQVDNPQQRLLPGMFVRVRIALARFDAALAVPQQAVVRIGGKPHVWTIDTDAKAHRIAVTLGELIDRQYRVTAGLSAGQQVVVAGMERLAEGMPVATQAASAR